MGNNVSAAKPQTGGAISVAPAGTPLPTDAVTSLSAAFTKLGYISDSGLTNAIDINTDSVKAWGGDEVLITYGGRKETFKYELIEATNINVLKQIFGEENVTGSMETGIAAAAKSNIELPEQVIVAEMVLKDNAVKRIVIPAGRIIDIADITYADSDAIGYDVTISAVADAYGYTHYEYIKGATGATGATNG